MRKIHWLGHAGYGVFPLSTQPIWLVTYSGLCVCPRGRSAGDWLPLQVGASQCRAILHQVCPGCLSLLRVKCSSNEHWEFVHVQCSAPCLAELRPQLRRAMTMTRSWQWQWGSDYLYLCMPHFCREKGRVTHYKTHSTLLYIWKTLHLKVVKKDLRQTFLW